LDEKSGPGQNVLGSDGIGDTQYTVAANNIDNYPLVQPFNRHDIGIVNVITSKTAIGQGFTLYIDVKILNYGLYDETFTISVRANTLVIAMQTITLTKRNSFLITFPWSTIGVAKGTYTMTVVVDTVPDETDVADNMYPDGSVTITWLGDLNKDFVVDEDDLWIFCGAFIDYYKIHVRNINCDFDDNFKIDEDDLWIMAQAFIDYWKHH
jgi:hypothetical protein